MTISYNLFFILFIFYYLTSLIFSILQKNKVIRVSKSFIVCFIFLLCIIIFFGPDNLKDKQEYERIWELSQNVSLFDIRFGARYQNIEILFVIYMKLVMTLGFSFRGFCFVNAFITFIFSFIGLNYILSLNDNYDSKSMSMMVWTVYCSYFALHYGAIAIRAGLAIALGVFAIGFYMKTNKLFITIVFLIISMLMHNSCVAFVLILLIYKYAPRFRKRTYGFVFSSLIISLAIGLGRFLFKMISWLIYNFIVKFSISGFSYYLISYDLNVGLSDWFILIVFGSFVILTSFSNIHLNSLKVITLCGLIVLTLLYPIRSINRLYDEFLIFSIPIIVNSFGDRMVKSQKQFICCILGLTLLLPQIYSCY